MSRMDKVRRTPASTLATKGNQARTTDPSPCVQRYNNRISHIRRPPSDAVKRDFNDGRHRNL
ncbi:hypothetical protein, partial [Pseudomonas viridiflava]|uniref:hypothetical protein n=1 Tax=Pseudomonas viridiflava TaxID=33069 RepID=UPI0019CF68FB